MKLTFSERRYALGCCVRSATKVDEHHTRSLSRFVQFPSYSTLLFHFIFFYNHFEIFPFFVFQKLEYLSNNPEAKNEDGDCYIISSTNDANKDKIGPNDLTNRCRIKKEPGQASQPPKKRGRPRKDSQKPTACMKQNSTQSVKTVTESVRGENRRVYVPSQFYLSPYKQP